MTHREAVSQLAGDLRELGLARGMSVLVHTSLRSLDLGREGAPALWQSLLQVVGPSGTVLVPTLSYENVNEAQPHFHVRKTPSCVGAFPEWVRTQPSVVRSVHPTHSVAASGAGAEHLLSSHRLDRTPAGPNSPFRRLSEEDGWILMVGCGLLPNTSIHGIEELSEPAYLFQKELEFTCTDEAGASFAATYRCHGHFPQHYDRVTELLDRDELKTGAVGSARCHLIHAPALWRKADAALRRNPRFFVEDR